MDEKIKQVIIKLTLSGLPPSFQEHIIDRIHTLDEKQLNSILILLKDLDGLTVEYEEAKVRYDEVMKSISKQVQDKLTEKAKDIEDELVSQQLKKD